jgi:hypothetical protein
LVSFRGGCSGEVHHREAIRRPRVSGHDFA